MAMLVPCFFSSYIFECCSHLERTSIHLPFSSASSSCWLTGGSSKSCIKIVFDPEFVSLNCKGTHWKFNRYSRNPNRYYLWKCFSGMEVAKAPVKLPHLRKRAIPWLRSLCHFLSSPINLAAARAQQSPALVDFWNWWKCKKKTKRKKSIFVYSLT